MSRDFPNANSLWAFTIVETLARKGVEFAVLCPGSRNSPLLFACAECDRIEAIPVLDERSAGFFALGLAKRTGKAVAILCTSGSAVANLFPAIVEASEAGIPLVALTADRPSELRACRAGQTIDQTEIFGRYLRTFIELGEASVSPMRLRYVRQTLCSAVDFACGANAGPAQVNIPFGEPLVPVENTGGERFRIEDGFFDGIASSSDLQIVSRVDLGSILDTDRGLILAGPNSVHVSDKWIENASLLANALNWPVLADGLSPIRTRAAKFPNLVCGYEFAARSTALLGKLRPERLLVLGELPTSKKLREWIESLDLPMIVLNARLGNQDPTHSKSRRIAFDLSESPIEIENRPKSDFLEQWLDVERNVCDLLEKRMAHSRGIFEGKVARAVVASIPEKSALCVSNSMPPRDLEFYGAKNDRSIAIYGSRGANGIDGILSTAVGVAHRGKPTCLLIGDLALLHDTNGALLAKEFEGSLSIVLVNNSGGGIFRMLPVAKYGETFERHFVTDQKIEFEAWAKTYGIGYRSVTSVDALESALSRTPKGIRILELKTNSEESSETRRSWFREICAAL